MRSAIAGGAVLLTSLLYLARRCGALAALTARWQQHGTAGAVTAAQLLLAPPSRGATSLHSAVARGARMRSAFVLPTTYCALGGSAAGGTLSYSADRNCTGARGAEGWRLLANRSAADFVQCGRDDAFSPMWS